MTPTVWLIILIMYHGTSTKVIPFHGNLAECGARTLFEMRWDPMIQMAECVPWQGDEA